MATTYVTPGRGVLLTNNTKTNSMSPDYKGNIVLSRDYKAGETVKLSGWIKKTPKGVLVSIAEDNWKPDGQSQTQYPREINKDDSDIPF
jgi:hypothetical protein